MNHFIVAQEETVSRHNHYYNYEHHCHQKYQGAPRQHHPSEKETRTKSKSSEASSSIISSAFWQKAEANCCSVGLFGGRRRLHDGN